MFIKMIQSRIKMSQYPFNTVNNNRTVYLKIMGTFETGVKRITQNYEHFLTEKIQVSVNKSILNFATSAARMAVKEDMM